MKILAFSDVARWEGYEELVEKTEPDVIALPGDLTSDGFAAFWSEGLEAMPEDKRQTYEMILSKMHHATQEEERRKAYDQLHASERELYATHEFLEFRKRTHVDKFFEFLSYAGKKCPVLVVRGDHDLDFEGDYIPEKIRSIPGSVEISGRTMQIGDFIFLGLGYGETRYLGTLRPIVERFRGETDVVVTHCEQKRMPLIGALKPILVIRGHFGYGRFLVSGVPAVFTMGLRYCTIELERNRLPRIAAYRFNRRNRKVEAVEGGSCTPWFSRKSEFDLYDWLEPYPSDRSVGEWRCRS